MGERVQFAIVAVQVFALVFGFTDKNRFRSGWLLGFATALGVPSFLSLFHLM